MSDTPRTDDVEAYSSVPGDFARALERELSAALARAEAAEANVSRLAALVCGMQVERDEARAELKETES